MTAKDAVHFLMETSPRHPVLRALKRDGTLREILYGDEDGQPGARGGRGTDGGGRAEERRGREGGASLRRIGSSSSSSSAPTTTSSSSSRPDRNQPRAESDLPRGQSAPVDDWLATFLAGDGGLSPSPEPLAPPLSLDSATDDLTASWGDDR